MFTGIVRAQSPVQKAVASQGEVQLLIERPSSDFFSQLAEGDSVSVNGLCLTIEKLLPQFMQFHLGQESVKITGWSKPEQWQNHFVNLEPPLRMMDFIGGHFVSGHAHGMAEIIERKIRGHNHWLGLKVPSKWKTYLWSKAFIAINGVSLTITSIKGDCFFVCLVPETLKNTNLGDQQVGEQLSFEIDYWSLVLKNSLQKNY